MFFVMIYYVSYMILIVKFLEENIEQKMKVYFQLIYQIRVNLILNIEISNWKII